MSNIYHSISEKLVALNIDIYHYEDIVRCYVLAELNIEHSRKPDYADGIHTAKIDPESVKHRKRPSVYRFSTEISLFYTVHQDKHNTYVGEAYCIVSLHKSAHPLTPSQIWIKRTGKCLNEQQMHHCK